ncbi:MAG TPA: hypothetical protein VGQ16_01040 [Vicinamibacterales bacterium]|jgi:hypothetical protein|nr:hypothetical protein [Vicinamibacterales bacterium]
MAIKRLHYYDQQFLVEADFTAEQRYHLDMRRRLSRVLHTFGIADGLEVARTGTRQVTVRAGTAIDNTGRELVVEADQILDLSNLTNFPGSATVFVTIAYQEAQTDPSTATGAPGNTRFTEAPLVQATSVPPAAGGPPTDGSVVILARFVKTTTGDVPGNLNDLLDSGVRQSVSSKIGPGAIAETNLAAALAAKINTPSGIVSIDGVNNPGGNIDLIPANAVTLTPNNTNKTITIGESHSAISGNPHNTTAAQLLGYDLRVRAFNAFSFTHVDANGATRTISNLGVQPRIVLAVCQTSCLLGTRFYGGGSFGFFDAASGVQRCFGTGITANSATDWFMRSSGVGVAGICSANFIDATIAPARTEDLLVTIAPTATGLTATLTRNSTNGFPPSGSGFSLICHIYYMGA